MKCEIKADGTLHIAAETELESYALRQWCHGLKCQLPEKMLVQHGLEQTPVGQSPERRIV